MQTVLKLTHLGGNPFQQSYFTNDVDYISDLIYPHFCSRFFLCGVSSRQKKGDHALSVTKRDGRLW